MKVKRSDDGFVPYAIVIAVQSERDQDSLEEVIAALEKREWDYEETFDFVDDMKLAAKISPVKAKVKK